MSSATVPRFGSSSTQLRTALPMPAKLNSVPASVISPPMKAKRLPFDQLWGALLAVVLLQLRLVIKEIELRRRADHVQVDDVLCFALGGAKCGACDVCAVLKPLSYAPRFQRYPVLLLRQKPRGGAQSLSPDPVCTFATTASRFARASSTRNRRRHRYDARADGAASSGYLRAAGSACHRPDPGEEGAERGRAQPLQAHPALTTAGTIR
jgi:hypothetical protein